MEIDPAMPKDAGYYECQADNKYAIDRRGFIAKYELNWKNLMNINICLVPDVSQINHREMQMNQLYVFVTTN